MGGDPLPAKIVAAIDRLSRARRSHRQSVASEHQLTPLQVDLLMTLAAAPPPQPLVGHLAADLGVAQPTVTESLHALERKGLVTRDRPDGDRRRTSVRLTDAGGSVAIAAHQADVHLYDAVAALPRPHQETTLVALLTIISDLVDDGVIDVARTCLTCRFHEQRGPSGHHCTLLAADLPTAELQVNCPEHQRRVSTA